MLIDEPVKATSESRSDRKRKVILEAATRLFLEKGFDGTSMDDVATLAMVSKPTVYKYFEDKNKLYTAIVRSTVDNVDQVVRIVSSSMATRGNAEKALRALAQEFLTVLMKPDLLRLRRMIIANADRFPEVARSWYENGFGRVLATLAGVFADLTNRGYLRHLDPQMAAEHFVGLVLWIPLNKAMFGAEAALTDEETARLAKSAVRIFLNGYRA